MPNWKNLLKRDSASATSPQQQQQHVFQAESHDEPAVAPPEPCDPPSDFGQIKVVEYGYLDNDGINRDALTSARWTSNTLFWLGCDSQPYDKKGSPCLPVVTNTASFSDRPHPSKPGGLKLRSPQGFGKTYLPFPTDMHPPYGQVGDGTRWVGWPATAPIVTFNYEDTVGAFVVVSKTHLRVLDTLNDAPAHIIYHLVDKTGGKKMAEATVAANDFWTTQEVGYGAAASVIRDGYAYMYGYTPGKKLALARCSLDSPFKTLADRSLYEYWVNGAWTRSTPNRNDPNIALDNTTANQGSIHYSEMWRRYVWIGGNGFPCAQFLISTSPSPEGPWTEQKMFFEGEGGNGWLPAYCGIAQPALGDGTGRHIFLTWTKQQKNKYGVDCYEHPLVRVDWPTK